MRHHTKPPVLITSAPLSRADERHHREVQYLFTMGLRVACFIVAVAVPVTAVRITAIVGTVVLPWVAVVAANAVRSNLGGGAQAFVPGQRREIEEGRRRLERGE